MKALGRACPIPLVVFSFRALCTGEEGAGEAGVPLWYKGTLFHRIVPGFMVQVCACHFGALSALPLLFPCLSPRGELPEGFGSRVSHPSFCSSRLFSLFLCRLWYGESLLLSVSCSLHTRTQPRAHTFTRATDPILKTKQAT